LPAPRRICVVGCGGAGKSTLARRLGEVHGLPVVHLDAEHWLPSWTRPDREDWRRKQAELVAGERWVVDGNYGGSFDVRFPRADLIVMLDLPRWRCLLGVARRSVRWWGRTRPDSAPGCPERLPTAEFLRWIWRYRRESLPRLEAAIAEHGAGAEVVRVRTRRQAAELARVGSAA
jgi:adenylate kinase family enzyme